MPRLSGQRPNPLHPASAIPCALLGLALLLSAGVAWGQATESDDIEAAGLLPSAPQAQVNVEAPPAAASDPRSTPDKPVVTIAPHAEDSRWWISGQANIIYQGRLPFHSAYEGPNSFRNSAEYKTSLVGTLFTAIRPTRSSRYNTDLILDVESAGGR